MIHQYTRGFGHPRLITALAKLYSQLIGREINPQTEIVTTLGAYEALYSAITGHVDDGDEVIIIEPFFDCYEPMVKYAGGVPKFIPLRLKNEVKGRLPSSADYVLDPEELESMFNSKTKIIILNTPNNPLGKVFTEKELTHIADLCKKWNVLCISDEVYEWLTFKPNKHIRIATLPGMWERTLTIGSAGKTFSVTGWKLGWVYGPANLMVNIQMIHQNSVYTGVTPIQEAAAIAFETELPRLGTDECYFISMPKELEKKRDYTVKFLSDVGMVPIVPEGGYFIIADWSPLESRVDMSSEKDKYKDYRFTKWMTKNVGLQGIPPTAFYSEAHKPLAENTVRYCFMKKDENLTKAAEILKKWKDGHPDYVPEIAKEALLEVAKSNDPSVHQYSISNGHPRLLNALSKLYSKLLGRQIDPQTELLSTMGANEALYCAILGLIEDGDEVVVIEPFFDLYVPLIKMAGGIPRYVTLKKRCSGPPKTSADWILDLNELQNVFNKKTKAVIMNTPINPLGKIFEVAELQQITDLCKKWNAICISDEVYEWMVYKPREHLRIATFPGMWERTLTIGSGGKSFCITGWKVGWVYGPSHLMSHLKVIHQMAVYAGSTPLQEAVAIMLEKEIERMGKPDSFFHKLQENLKKNRDYIVGVLTRHNFLPVVPDSGIFLLANWSNLEDKLNINVRNGDYKDVGFTKWLIENIGLHGMPSTMFYNEENKNDMESFVRFCFIKDQETLEILPKILDKLQLHCT
nr:unnamed protein product [Callosobruchus analis]